jgi:dihydropteroate synthase
MRHPAGLPADLSVLDRTLVMGILNVTPDSFSDGGLYFDHDAAVEHGLAMAADGADVVDVGGESTRPGAVPVPSDEEQRRVVEVVRDLAAEGVPVSIDTRHADVAAACVDAGAVVVNDVSSGRGDAAMWAFVADAGVPYILMHNRGDGPSRNDLAHYASVSDVWTELHQQADRAERAGVRAESLVLDPGFGFAKDAGVNWSLLGELTDGPPWGQHQPVLVGVSRKRFLATHPDGRPRNDDSMEQRDRLTLEITERAARHGVWCVRVHDVARNAEAVRRVGATARMES